MSFGILSPFPTVETVDTIAAGVAGIQAAITAGAVTITVTTPVQDGGSLELVKGDGYMNADGRAIGFTFAGGPSLTGATVKLVGELAADSRIGFQVTGSISGNAVTFEIPATVTAGLYVGQDAYAFTVAATLADLSEATLLRGTITVTE